MHVSPNVVNFVDWNSVEGFVSGDFTKSVFLKGTDWHYRAGLVNLVHCVAQAIKLADWVAVEVRSFV